jgi:hypothetical protein
MKKNLDMLSRIIKLMNGLIRIKLKNWINDMIICIYIFSSQLIEKSRVCEIIICTILLLMNFFMLE